MAAMMIVVVVIGLVSIDTLATGNIVRRACGATSESHFVCLSFGVSLRRLVEK